MELKNNQKALLYALLYSDIFNFPLTEEELWRNLIAKKGVDRETLKKTVKSLSKKIIYKNGFYCLAGKEKIINKRIARAKIAQNKIKIATDIAKYLSYIPTILFVGITGRLAHIDADTLDDIDFIIITKENTIWATRLLTLAVLELMNIRRKRNDTNPKNKICPNLIIEESALLWPAEKHDLYTAHEIIHIYPLFVRNNIYQKFLNSNKWIKNFYPNISVSPKREPLVGKPRPYLVIKAISFILTLPLLEYIFEKFQRIYMKKKRTTEIILPDFLAFHPRDYRKEILNNFNEKIKQYGSLTNI
jgi:hypothetical protein